jgi:hypothetical protein
VVMSVRLRVANTMAISFFNYQAPYRQSCRQTVKSEKLVKSEGFELTGYTHGTIQDGHIRLL